MTSKDYQLIASILNRMQPPQFNPPETSYLYKQWVSTCKAFTKELETTNPRFNRDKFLAACGITQNDK